MIRPMLIAGAMVATVLASGAAAQAGPALTPAQAIAAIEAAADHEVEGVFEMDVVSTGASGFSFYLNSMADYRAAGNFTVEMLPEAVNHVKATMGDFPDVALLGKRVRVTGVARRYAVGDYFQYRVEVAVPAQIEVLG